MGLSKLPLAALLLALVALQLLGRQVDCGRACSARCRKASRWRMCTRACGTCCRRCNCVPPGTAGNRDVCPCYAKMTTHGGRLKCP
ncbi:unnamed protein product [Spirodela intermedia]|uniref:Uncharacterized protein n=1 Tax=Spirodela intermedia TaxID=51605 RepID=A0A7I8IUS6_SPIIN|nr:unnamed protein product [Spirodela intermedia]CAA6661578.1 unnamed protein product [Spirodela intermedia]